MAVATAVELQHSGSGLVPSHGAAGGSGSGSRCGDGGAGRRFAGKQWSAGSWGSTACPSSSGRGCRSSAATTDGRWNLLTSPPLGWEPHELRVDRPHSNACLASLLHGDGPEYFAYACVLGRRLRDEAAPHGPDRVLLCGPGSCCDRSLARQALREAGWTHLLPVEPIAAEHLDKSRTKRHALVFTKLRVLELPYDRVLLLDLDLLPRTGVDMAELLQIEAPAAKYHCASYQGPEPEHGELIPLDLRDGFCWSPNAGVMRLDPLPQLRDRMDQVLEMVREVSKRWQPTFLPEQYFLAERLDNWRHLSSPWNWEVWPQFEDPKHTHPLLEAREEAKRQGWACYQPEKITGEMVNRIAKVWHYSGTGETAPWLFMDLHGPEEVQDVVAHLFRARDPGSVVARALAEWRRAFDELLAEACRGASGTKAPAIAEVLQLVYTQLAERAWQGRSVQWKCDACMEYRSSVRELDDIPYQGRYCSAKWRGLSWACADCIVDRIRTAGDKECYCSSTQWRDCSWHWH
mmetsp:Transcript_48408/g.122075  ORF Transcript_48408/g.122075 Transcript_48408/m.122075 type:complete len:518 (-) Transcript_48408:55-1608(-)